MSKRVKQYWIKQRYKRARARKVAEDLGPEIKSQAAQAVGASSLVDTKDLLFDFKVCGSSKGRKHAANCKLATLIQKHGGGL